MADRASADRVAADMNPPNYRAGIQRIRQQIVKKKERISALNGELSDEWAKVEGHKINKKAARVFLTLDKMESDERDDFIRSLNGLMDAAGWDKETADLVDKAQGNVVKLRVGKSDDGDDSEDENGEGEDGRELGGDNDLAEIEEALEEEPAAPRRSRRKKDEPEAKAESDVARAADARRTEMRQKLAGVPTPLAEGDDSDLAQS